MVRNDARERIRFLAKSVYRRKLMKNWKWYALTSLAALLAACPGSTPATGLTVTGPDSLSAGAAPAGYVTTATPTGGTGTVLWTLNPPSGGGTLSTSTGTLTNGVANVNYTPPATVATAQQITLTATLQGSANVVGTKTITVNPATSAGITVAGKVWKWNNRPFGGLSVTITDSSGNKPEVTTANDGSFTVNNVITPYRISVVPAQATEVLPLTYDRMTSASPQVVMTKTGYTLGIGGGLPGFENECTPTRQDATIIASLNEPVAANSRGKFFFVGEGIDFRPLRSNAQSTDMNTGAVTRTFAVKFDQNFCKTTIVGKLLYIERSLDGAGNPGSVTKIASRNVSVITGNTYCGDDSAATCGAAQPTSKLSVITRAGSRIRGKIFWPQGVNTATVSGFLRFVNNEATDVPAYVAVDQKVITRTGNSDDYELAVVDFSDDGLDYRASAIAQDVSGTQIQWYHSDRIAANVQNIDLPVASLGETQTPDGDFTQTEFGGRNTDFTQGQVSSSAGATTQNSNFYFRFFTNPAISKYWLGGTPLQTMSLPTLRLPAVVSLNERFNWAAVNALLLRDASVTDGSDKVTSVNSGASRPYGVLRNLYGVNAFTEPDLIKFGSINTKQTCFAVISTNPIC
jgi:hypothetical protein